MMKIGVVGGGVVGRATARAFLEHVDEIGVYDVMPERRTHNSWESLLDMSDLTFICLPTPQKSGSLACDLSAIDDMMRLLSEAGFGDKNLVLRSTVPIGTTEALAEKYNLSSLVHSPEFLTARCAATDAHLPARNIIGMPRLHNDRKHPLFSDNRAAESLSILYHARFPGIQVHLMTSSESEAVKLFTNSFFAVKIAYFNEIRELAEWHGLDWDRVLAGVLSDGRIAHSHTRVPGPDGRPGFGGACLPKDLASLISQMMEVDGGLYMDARMGSVIAAAHVGNEDRRKR